MPGVTFAGMVQAVFGGPRVAGRQSMRDHEPVHQRQVDCVVGVGIARVARVLPMVVARRHEDLLEPAEVEAEAPQARVERRGTVVMMLDGGRELAEPQSPVIGGNTARALRQVHRPAPRSRADCRGTVMNTLADLSPIVHPQAPHAYPSTPKSLAVDFVCEPNPDRQSPTFVTSVRQFVSPAFLPHTSPW